MKKPLLLLLCLFTVIGYAKDPHIKAVYALIERVTPGYGKQIKLQLIDPANGEDVYEISSEKGKVLLKGNNAIALSTAFNQYLKYTCNAHVSWLGNQLNLPENLPLPQKTIRNTINGKYRVYMNCLLGLGTLATRNRFHGYEFYQYAFGNSRIGSCMV